MTITNGYTDLATLKSELGINDTGDDTRLEAAVNAASRQIDSFCGRRFWQDATVQIREFYAHDSLLCEVDDISTTTGLIVKIDEDDTGSFSTTLTILTDFLLRPLNAADRVPVWPYTEVVLVDGNYYFPMSSSQRPGVQVTARFGWPAVPDDVKQACLIQSKNLYKAASGTYAGFQLSAEAGLVMRTMGMDPVAAALLEPYRKGWIG